MSEARETEVDNGRRAPSRAERQLAAAQQITHIGSWEWNAATNEVSWSAELYRIYGIEPYSVPITFEFFLSRVLPADRERVAAAIHAAVANGGRFAWPERIVCPDGSVRDLETIGEAEVDATGRAIGLVGTCRDVTDRVRAERLAAAEQRVFEAVAGGEPLPAILTQIATLIEDRSPGTIASIQLLDDEGKHILHGAAPGLPAAYNAVVNGVPIGPKAASCGTAAYRKEPVYVIDIESDPLWEDYRPIARAHGLRACWSSPIIARDGRVLGTFALYYRQPKAPTVDDVQIVARATQITGVAIENRLLANQLRELSAHLEAVREEERRGIAREIHDELGQALTALKLDLAALGRGTEDAQARDRAKSLGESTDTILDVVRRISSELRPGVLDHLGLASAIEWQAAEFTRRTGTPCEVTIDTAATIAFDDRTSTTAFRIFQEALTNVARHANAKHVSVTLDTDGGSISLAVSDDGRGITTDEVTSPRSLGLLGMRERVLRLGGELAISGAPGDGTKLFLRLPLSPRR